ncbi:hypothetical protein N7456_009631 [Penicillium angulare]|uniref:Uncharacterized protein n=1 Tax=Penicillium angulare TaxID=116970 RepID=A0A9W9F504_9EURO|nr:hypothetical protein N7456_009631 [Penicillium angulare]
MPPVMILTHHNEMMLPPFVGMAPFLVRESRPRTTNPDPNPGPVKEFLISTRETFTTLYQIVVLLKDIVVLSGEIIIKTGEVIVAVIDLCEDIWTTGPALPPPRRDNIPPRRPGPPPILGRRRNSIQVSQVQTQTTTTTTTVVDVDEDRVRRGSIFLVDSDSRV